MIDVVHRLVHTYVSWAIAELTRTLRPLVLAGVQAFGAQLDRDDEASVDLIIVGLIAEVVATVRTWLDRPRPVPSAAALSSRLADSVWYQLDGHARTRGAVIDPSCTLEELLQRALAGPSVGADA